jgi:hypothetical protein
MGIYYSTLQNKSSAFAPAFVLLSARTMTSTGNDMRNHLKLPNLEAQNNVFDRENGILRSIAGMP